MDLSIKSNLRNPYISIFFKVTSFFIRLIAVSYTHLSKTFVYGSNSVTAWENGVPSSTTYYTDGKASAMSSDAKCIAFTRVFNFGATLFYDKQINKDNKIYSQLKGDYEYRNTKGTDQTWYRQNASFYTHYGLSLIHIYRKHFYIKRCFCYGCFWCTRCKWRCFNYD